MRFELRQLHYFVTVCAEGQMTRAAQRLHLAQPALSQAIAQLESQVGVRLLERHARGVEPTPAGLSFLAKAKATLDAADDADATARSLARVQAGMLPLGFLSLSPPMMAGDLFDRFSAAHPEVAVSWHELALPSSDTRAWLGDLDAALMWEAPNKPGISNQPIRTSPLVVVTAEHHPLARRASLTVQEILDDTFPGMHHSLDREWFGRWTLDRDRGAPAHFTEDRATTPQEVAAIIAAGRAITTTPAVVAAGFAHLGIASIPLIGVDPVVLSLVWREELANPHLEALLALAAQSVTAHGEAA